MHMLSRLKIIKNTTVILNSFFFFCAVFRSLPAVNADYVMLLFLALMRGDISLATDVRLSPVGR